MEDFNREIIENSINKGAEYLIRSQNEDGGIHFQDNSKEGRYSGIWVTAEALEFFLSSKIIPFSMHKKIERMIDFLLETQSEDGCWSVIPKENGKSTVKDASAIATGHCTYALKLAMVGNHDDSGRIKNAIKKGEDWLRCNCVERDGFVFWETQPSSKKNGIDPNKNEVSRMAFIMDTFYAVFGLVNPKGYPEDNDRDRTLIAKAASFFNEQANYFIRTYKTDLERLKAQYAKVASTLCRIVNGLYLLKAKITDSTKADLKLLLQACPDLFTTSNIIMHVAKVKQFYTAYNNNTPFDMAHALINLEVGAEELKHIMSAYIDNQTTEGFWYLNFSSTFSVTTWSTSEALLVLERVLEQYNFIELEEQKKLLKIEKEENDAKFKKQKMAVVSSRIISVVISLAAIILFGVIVATQPLTETMKWWVTMIFIPLGVNAVGTVIKWIWEAIKVRINKQ